MIEVDAEGFAQAAPVVAAIAEAEGLASHAESVRLRQRRMAEEVSDQ